MRHFQGLTFDEHICCICFESKGDGEWWADSDGQKWDIHVSCKEMEDETARYYGMSDNEIRRHWE